MKCDIDFGLKIRQLMELNNETYQEAATRFGSNASTIHRWTKHKDVSTEVLKLVCEKYKVPMSYFLSESGNYIQRDNTISGGINVVGEKIINYGHKGQSEGLTDKENADYKILIERLRSCEEKNKLLIEKNNLLERMITMLEKK